MNYIATIGLEIHVQLKTRTKIWCGCPNVDEAPPNTAVCPVCLGYPGVMPVLNRDAVRLTIQTGLMLGCNINRRSKFDRKNYFYPDQAKNYQISQYDLPFCEGGGLEVDVDGERKFFGLTRIHLEEDVAKSIHTGSSSLVDFNRAGTPLMELVTDPCFSNPDEVFAYMQALRQILIYGDISDANLEQGNMRCDVNASVRPEGQTELGTKTELKNMNTLRGVHRALGYEIQRQEQVLRGGGVIPQETRRWDDEAGVTTGMRSKEYAHDYRYFPEPDLVPVELSSSQIDTWREAVPELPEARRRRMVERYGIPEYDAGVLAADKAVADYYELAAQQAGNSKAVSNWIMTEMLRALSEHDQDIRSVKIPPAALAELVQLVDAGTINATTAKELFNELFEQGGEPARLVEERGLAQVSDTGALESLVEQVLAEQPQSVADVRAGKKNAVQFLIGQVMRLSRGKADPVAVRSLLQKKLES